MQELGVDKTREDASSAFSDVSLHTSIVGAGGLYFLGLAKNNDHLVETGRLGEEAMVNSFLVVEALKLATNRERPNEGNGRGGFWPHGTRSYETDGSFPSGHAAATFALARGPCLGISEQASADSCVPFRPSYQRQPGHRARAFSFRRSCRGHVWVPDRRVRVPASCQWRGSVWLFGHTADTSVHTHVWPSAQVHACSGQLKRGHETRWQTKVHELDVAQSAAIVLKGK